MSLNDASSDGTVFQYRGIISGHSEVKFYQVKQNPSGDPKEDDFTERLGYHHELEQAQA